MSHHSHRFSGFSWFSGFAPVGAAQSEGKRSRRHRKPVSFREFYSWSGDDRMAPLAVTLLKRISPTDLARLHPGSNQLDTLRWFRNYFSALAVKIAHAEEQARRLGKQLSSRFVAKLMRRAKCGVDLHTLIFSAGNREGFEAQLFSEQPADSFGPDDDGLLDSALLLIYYMVLIRAGRLNETVNPHTQGISECVKVAMEARGLPAIRGVDAPDPDDLEAWWMLANKILCASFRFWHLLPIEAAMAAKSPDDEGSIPDDDKTPARYELVRRAERVFKRALKAQWRCKLIGVLLKDSQEPGSS